MTEQELKECIAEVKYSAIPKESKKKIMNVLYEKLHENGWILCENVLPEDGQEVLASDGEYVYLVEYDTDSDCPFGDIDNIQAWQLCPQLPGPKEAVKKNLIYPECDCQLRFCPEPEHGN